MMLGMYGAVLITTIIVFFVGFLWYGPMLFGNTRMKLMNMKMDGKKMGGDMTMTYITHFIMTLITVYVFAQLLTMSGVTSISAAVMVGFRVWLGFFAAPGYGVVLWDKKPLNLFLINTGHSLVMLLLSAIFLMWMM